MSPPPSSLQSNQPTNHSRPNHLPYPNQNPISITKPQSSASASAFSLSSNRRLHCQSTMSPCSQNHGSSSLSPVPQSTSPDRIADLSILCPSLPPQVSQARRHTSSRNHHHPHTDVPSHHTRPRRSIHAATPVDLPAPLTPLP
ncbi:hypothetical protein M0R45_031325 [Rubus argutus]|uniref:Uncharacterized protein n=1 Tax=Rubus argutus TaxID=59490 RepID=A0AAW1WG29_RUBAR